ncbi:MAG: hypothetical protein IKN75_07920 [Prevotella sp.]|nr:hypothetical protein [Prevotella sp.]
MKQKLFSILALLLMAVSGAWAQHDPTYIVAGSNAEIFGSVWDGTYEANKMTKGGDGKYTKTYNVEDAVDDIQLKVVKDGQDWIGDETGNNVTFSMKQSGSFTVTIDPNANPVYVTVTGDNVVFANTEYAINYATGMQNGTVTGPDTAKEDDEVTLTITPATGYVLESISVTGVTTENAVEITDGKFTMPAEDVNVIATFKLVTYAITLAEGTEDAGNWTISPASAVEGETVTITYNGNKRVQGVTAVKKTQKATAHTLAASAVGDVIGADGNVYTVDDTHELPTGVKAEAVVTYKSGSNGFALAIVDYPDKGYHDAASGTYLTQWSDAHPVSGCTWVLPTREQWVNTYNGCAGTAPTAIHPATGYEGNMGNLNTYLTGAGGTAMNGNHWTNTSNSGLTDAYVCTNSSSSANTCNFNSNVKNVNLFSRYGIAF